MSFCLHKPFGFFLCGCLIGVAALEKNAARFGKNSVYD
jgi:hypothetical protein